MKIVVCDYDINTQYLEIEEDQFHGSGRKRICGFFNAFTLALYVLHLHTKVKLEL